MAQEVTYLSDELVTITSARAILAGTTYALPNITSVRHWTVKKSWWPVGLCILCGLLSVYSVGTEGAGWTGAAFWFILSLGLMFWHFLVRKDQHFVKIGTAAGEVDAIVAKDRAYIARVVAALNEAIARR